jgi:hypothetical protein
MTNEIQIDKSPTEIIDHINSRLEQRKSNRLGQSYGMVDYRKFEIKQDIITIEKYPSIFNPLGGFGTVTFGLSAIEKGSRIKVSIESYAKYGFAFIFVVFIMLTIPILLISRQDLLKTGLFVSVFWGIAFGFAFLMSRLNKNRLQEFTQTILDDIKKND